jgi:cell shape-determining protein MreD
MMPPLWDLHLLLMFGGMMCILPAIGYVVAVGFLDYYNQWLDNIATIIATVGCCMLIMGVLVLLIPPQ